MTTVEHLLRHADFAFKELLTAIEGVTQAQAWAVLPNNGPDYLHTDATIHGLVLHMASGKFMYASAAFLDGKYRWSRLADEIESFEPSWEAAVDYLKRSQEVWINSWKDLSDEELTKEVANFRGKMVPVHELITIQNHHDGWHGGQIVMLRYAIGESEEKPPSYAEDIRKYCAELPLW